MSWAKFSWRLRKTIITWREEKICYLKIILSSIFSFIKLQRPDLNLVQALPVDILQPEAVPLLLSRPCIALVGFLYSMFSNSNFYGHARNTPLLCCGSRMFISVPWYLSRFWIFFLPGFGFRIPATTTTKEEGEQNWLSYLFCGHKIHITENYFIFEQVKKKKLSQLLLSSQKYGLGIRDPRSGKKLILDPDPGVKKSTGFRIRNTVHQGNAWPDKNKGTTAGCRSTGSACPVARVIKSQNLPQLITNQSIP